MDWSPDRILDFQPRPHAPIEGRTSVDLLWPVRAWRVLFSRRERRPLDVFQLVALRMAQAGEIRGTEIAKLTGLDPALVTYTSTNLVALGLLDTDGRLTDNGRSALEQDAAERESVELGWVFEEVLTGDYFPVFSIDLPTAECEVGDDGRPILKLGTHGRPKNIKPFIIFGTSTPPSRPDPRLIDRAIERHERMLTRHRRTGRMVGLRLELPPLSVRLADAEPFEGHLRTLLYTTSSDDVAPWFVADPFGFGGSEFLRGILEDRQNHNDPSAREVIRRLLQRDATASESTITESQYFEHMARERVLDGLPIVGTRGEEDVRTAMTKAFRELVRLEEHATSHESMKMSALDVTSTLAAVRQGLERGLELLRTECPLGNAWRHLAVLPSGKKGAPTDRSGRERAETIRMHATRLGFADDAIPKAMLSTRFGKVQDLATVGSSANIRPLLAALCLSAPDHLRHPLELIARDDPRWLARIDRLASMAGDAVHASSRTYELDDVARAVEESCNLLYCLLKSLANYRKG